MMMGRRHGWTQARGFLTRLARDTRGNTLAIMAIALFPLAGLIGGGLDISRMYIVKTRLQHACDAGALAGRKAMGGGVWAQTVNGIANYPNASAERFFTANYNVNAYGVERVTKSFSENAGKVSGTATAVVPMTLMRIFGRTTESLTVTCDAEMRLPNTDVMFVLDVTGSMSSKAISTDPQTKIEALRSSVKCFYEIVARLDTDEACAGGTPSGGVGDDVQVRFGFVPYDMNVNVGRLLPSEYFVDSWAYQSRQPASVTGTWNRWASTATAEPGAWSGWSNTGTQAWAGSSGACKASLVPIPGDDYTPTSGTPRWPESTTQNGRETAAEWPAYGPAIHANYQIAYNSGDKFCYQQKRTRSILRYAWYSRGGGANALTFPAWTYKQVTFDVSPLKSGSGWNAGISLPVGNYHSDVTVPWNGCIEERKTVRQASYSPIPADARDLDIDLVPNSDPDTKWAPALNGAVFVRKASYVNSGSYTQDEVTSFLQEIRNTSADPYYDAYGSHGYSCPTAAKKLQGWPNASDFDSYVDTMWGGGNTYHDIGILWGARLMSPTGMFREENEFTEKGGEIQRHMIFMTDGDSCTADTNYQAYGIGWWDRRQTDPSVAPTGGCQSNGTYTLTQQVNARTAALCTAVKNKNITLWVIWFGAASTTIENQLKACSTPGRYFAARNQTDLQNTFRAIATEISQLRLTK